jgi:V/A-type H+-transporting ATPase subunit E
MVEKLISKLIEEAKGKAEEIFEKGKKEFEEKFKIEKEKLDIEFEEKLKLEKKKIDSEIERGIINFKIEKEKEILAIKNKIIDEVIEKIKDRFNLFLNENMEEVIEKILSNLNEKDVEIFVPEGQKINLKYKVVNDKNLKNSFRIKSKLWEIEFSWDSIKTIFEGFIKEEASKIIFNE